MNSIQWKDSFDDSDLLEKKEKAENILGNIIRELWEENHYLKTTLKNTIDVIDSYLNSPANELNESISEIKDSIIKNKPKESVLDKLSELIENTKKNIDFKEEVNLESELVNIIRSGMSPTTMRLGTGFIHSPKKFIFENIGSDYLIVFKTSDTRYIQLKIEIDTFKILYIQLIDEYTDDEGKTGTNIKELDFIEDSESIRMINDFVRKVIESEIMEMQGN